MTFTPQVTPMNIQQQGAENFPVVSQWNDVVYLPANTAESYSLSSLLTASAIKGKKLFLVFASDGPFWANFHETAAIPAASSQGSTDGHAPEYSPSQRYVDTDDANNPVTSISFIASAITRVSIQVYMV